MRPYARRHATNTLVLTLSMVATVLGLAWLAVVLWTLLRNGIGAISLDLFVQTTPAPGSQGGLLNAIYGSLIMTLVATVGGSPIGILAGTFLAEYGRQNPIP